MGASSWSIQRIVSRRTVEESLRATTTDWPGIQVSIADTGKGISREELARVFDPFFTTKSEGTGLGLAVSHGMIVEHHGEVDVESDGKTGTTFRVVFPILPRQEDLGPSASTYLDPNHSSTGESTVEADADRIDDQEASIEINDSDDDWKGRHGGDAA